MANAFTPSESLSRVLRNAHSVSSPLSLPDVCDELGDIAELLSFLRERGEAPAYVMECLAARLRRCEASVADRIPAEAAVAGRMPARLLSVREGGEA